MSFGRLERTPGPQPMSDINMTPLVDVMLVLVGFIVGALAANFQHFLAYIQFVVLVVFIHNLLALAVIAPGLTIGSGHGGGGVTEVGKIMVGSWWLIPRGTPISNTRPRYVPAGTLPCTTVLVAALPLQLPVRFSKSSSATWSLCHCPSGVSVTGTSRPSAPSSRRAET